MRAAEFRDTKRMVSSDRRIYGRTWCSIATVSREIMGQTHPFRFGVINERMTTRAAWLEGARRAEALGYATFLIRDHLRPDFFGPQFAPISALTAAAMATTTLRVGTLVLDNDFRHPAVLAKEAATLDLLSDGRFELGLGAGWLEAEYAAAGIPFDSNGTRISRLEEAIPILKGLFGDGVVTANGTHYAVTALDGYPKPAQRPHPPLMIGAAGKRMLRLAGREAEIVSIMTASVATGSLVVDPAARNWARVREQIDWIRVGAGERFDRIELSTGADVVVTGDRRGETERYIARQGWGGLLPEDVWAMPNVFIGTVDEIAEAMRMWRERLGLSYYVIDDVDMEAVAPIVALLTDPRQRD
jgi:probable F420-dependent oxidoreductase